MIARIVIALFLAAVTLPPPSLKCARYDGAGIQSAGGSIVACVLMEGE